MVTSNAIKSFNQHDSIAAHNHHSNRNLLVTLVHFNSFINHQIHERIEASQNTGYLPTSIQLNCNNILMLIKVYKYSRKKTYETFACPCTS